MHSIIDGFFNDDMTLKQENNLVCFFALTIFPDFLQKLGRQLKTIKYGSKMIYLLESSKFMLKRS